jgi:hypothetical protein
MLMKLWLKKPRANRIFAGCPIRQTIDWFGGKVILNSY